MSGVAHGTQVLDGRVFRRRNVETHQHEKFTYSKNGLQLTATYELTKANAVTNVNETARFTEAIADDVIRFRIRCANGTCQTDSKAVLTKPGRQATESVSVSGVRKITTPLHSIW